MVLDGTLTADGEGGRGPLDLIWRRETRGRTVILGEPGSGKTVLLIKLMLDALVMEPQASRVPVIMRLATWDVANQTFHDWLQSRLVEDYGCSRSNAELIIMHDMIIPVLDGLDEMPPERRPAVVVEINSAIARDSSFVIASRTTEYLETLNSAHADVLTGTVVVELRPLAPRVIRDYLILATPPGRSRRWDEVFELDGTEHDGRLAKALSTPLAVSLARFAYADRDEDPNILLELADGDAVEGHLLDQLLPNVYRGSASREHALIGHPVTYESFCRWLVFLAGHIKGRETYDIAWWEFAHALPRWFRTAAGVFIGAVAGSLIGTFTGGATGGLRGGLSYGAAGVLLGGTSCWLTCGFRSWRGWLPRPSRAGINMRSTGQPISRRFAHALWLGVAFGAAGGLILGLGVGLKFALETGAGAGLEDGILFGLISGLLVGLVIGITREFTTMFGEDADVSGAVDPRALLRADRARWIVTGLIVGLALAFAFRLTGELLAPVAKPLAVTNTGSIVVGLTVGLAGGIVLRAWGWLVPVRVWLLVARRAPWSIMSFLDNAHSREVLRQVGGVYQFRHALLRDRLAERSDRPPGGDGT